MGSKSVQDLSEAIDRVRGRAQQAIGARRRSRMARAVLPFALVCLAVGCDQLQETMSVRPRTLRDVPAARLAFRFEADVSSETLPPAVKSDAGATENLASIQADFEARRKDEALLRTVVSPDGLRAVALYATGETLEGEFRMDLYGADGMFVRNILPADLSGAFPSKVAWSRDGQQIAFIGVKSLAAQASPAPFDGSVTPPEATAAPADPAASPADPAATVAPLIAPVPAFSTEQVYLCDRDGFNLKPLTTRDGLIYFHFEWSPDGQAVAALACKEDEWNARRQEDKLPAGRPRLIGVDGRERLLDDRLTDALPVWSPDSSKVATAFDTDVAIYDAVAETPTGARISLSEPLLAASSGYDAEKLSAARAASGAGDKNQAVVSSAAPPSSSPPLSFNPVVRLEWFQPETLFVQTGFVRIYKGEPAPISNYMRWHVLHLSAQAALLSNRKGAGAEDTESMTPRTARAAL